MQKLIIIIMLLMSQTATADKLYLGMLSYHYDRITPYNETHELIGYEHDGWFIETFVNSKYRTTWYAGRIYRDIYKINDKWSFGADIGVIKGYDFHDREISVVGFPTLTYQREKVGIDIRFGYTEVVAARFTYNF